VLQSTASSTISESGSRISIYLSSLASGLVALEFSTSSHRAFASLAFTVLPTAFVLGWFTRVRLIDTSVANIVSLRRKSVIDTIPGCRVYDIATELSSTTGGTSKLVDRIEASGYCRRLPNPADRRSSLLELTEEGQRMLAEAGVAFDEEPPGDQVR